MINGQTKKMINGQTKFVKDALLEADVKSVLNIGFRYDSDLTVRDAVRANGATFSVLEAYGPNCSEMRAKGTADEVFEMDVRNIKDLKRTYDAIIWLHGPEHIFWEEFLEIREEIEAKANKLVIYQAPIGYSPQGELYENPYEKHVQTLEPHMFEELGYEMVLHDGKTLHEYDFVDGEWTFTAVHRVTDENK